MGKDGPRNLKLATFGIAGVFGFLFWQIALVILSLVATIFFVCWIFVVLRRRKIKAKEMARREELNAKAEQAKRERDSALQRQRELERQVERDFQRHIEQRGREEEAKAQRIAELKQRRVEQIARLKQMHKDKLRQARVRGEAARQFDIMCEDRKSQLRDIFLKYGFKTFEREWQLRVEHKADNHLESPYGKIRTRLHIAHRQVVVEVVLRPDGECASVRFGQRFLQNVNWDIGVAHVSKNLEHVSPKRRRTTNSLQMSNPHSDSAAIAFESVR